MKAEIDSPLAEQSKAQLLKTIDVEDLICQYQKKLKIDVSNYFQNLKEIAVYECNKTKYRFYYPFHIHGDSSFYEQLQCFEWYYMPWKWEHSRMKTLFKGRERILEIGSGSFGFVEKLHNEGFDISGLELNEDSIIKAKKLNLKVIEESIDVHAIKNPNSYDVVCSFQVLEHIYDVRSFIQAQIDCLKKDGKLILAVPNNDSFITLTDGGILNKPPHHMGLWNSRALKELTNCFNLKIEKVYYEPLQEYHLNWYVNSIIEKKIKPRRNLYKIFVKLKMKRLFIHYTRLNQKNIKGHTMLAVYKKV